MSTNTASPKAALSVPEFCKVVGISRSHAYQEIKSGRLEILKCGRRTLIAADAVTQWLGRLRSQRRRGVWL